MSSQLSPRLNEFTVLASDFINNLILARQADGLELGIWSQLKVKKPVAF